MASEVLIKILRSIPRFTFDFQPASKIFTLQFDSSYVQSLFVFAGIILIIGAALLLTITMTWICQCCTRQDTNVNFCLGICLFGNEHLNRNIMNSIISAEDISRNLLLADSQRSSLYTQRIELERWILCATLLSIMLIVLFAGVVAFCRQSRKGAVVFSGLGFAIFIVGWLLLAAIFPASMAFVDFCADSSHFLREYMSNETMELLEFYRKCNPVISHDNLPSITNIEKMSKQLSNVKEMSQKFDLKIEAIFNSSSESIELSEQVKTINDGVTIALKNIGALETTVACYTYHNDMLIMEQSFCVNGIIGSSILLHCLVLLETFLFTLLLIVSKSWHLFARLPSDYVEVDEEDPFFHEEMTVLFQDRTEQSTGTTSATCGLANGSINNHASASAALLNSNVETSTTLPWNRGLSSQPTASSAANAPPAVGTSSMMHTAYQANIDEAIYQRRNYHEQFDV
ncbi:Protein tweety-like [Dirofilaria immitis]|nr:Protein tweety-like [Dirofilaria immitis]